MNNYTKNFFFIILFLFSQQIAQGKFRVAPTITTFNASGCVGTDITISGSEFTGTTAVTINSAVATFTVVSNTEITATIPAGSEGVGFISITNATGTTNSSTPFISFAFPTGTPTITTLSGTVFCAGGGVEITANGTLGANESYQWYRNGAILAGFTQATLNVVLTGNYTVSIRNPFTNCETAQSAITTITDSPIPAGTPTVTTPNGTAFCGGNNLDIVATGTLGANEQYAWFKDNVNMVGENGATLSVSAGANYSVWIENTVTGCQTAQSSATTISENPIPVGTPTVTTPNGIAFCTGNTLDIVATGTLGANEQFQWFKDNVEMTGENSAILSVSIDGDYSVWIENTLTTCQTAQSSATTISGNPIPAGTPTVTTPNGIAFCTGNTLDIVATGTLGANEQYAWFKDNVKMVGENGATLSVSAGANYSVWIENTVTGCQTAQSAFSTIAENTSPSQPAITLVGDATFCNGDDALLVAPSGFGTYSWFRNGTSIGGNTQTLEVTTSGNYTLQVENGSGCESVASLATTITANPNPTVNAGGDLDICEGQTVNLNAIASGGTGGYSYDWSPSASLNDNTIQNPVATPTNTTIYEVEVTDGNLCTAFDDIQITVKDTPFVSLVSSDIDNTICEGDQITFTATGSAGTEFRFFINGVPQGAFSAVRTLTTAALAVGVRNITVSGRINGCAVTTNPLPITVNATTPVSIVYPTQTAYSLDRDTVALVGSPAGGTFSGNGVANNVFYVNAAGIGTHTITYNYINVGGCVSQANIVFNVSDIRAISLDPEYCQNTSPIVLDSTDVPSSLNFAVGSELISLRAGYFQGFLFQDVPIGNIVKDPTKKIWTIYPNLFDARQYFFIAEYSVPLAGISTQFASVVFLPAPTVNIQDLQSNYCYENDIALPIIAQTAGTFAWTGVDAGATTPNPTLNLDDAPNKNTTRNVTVGVTYTATNGCINTDSKAVTINGLPTANYTGLDLDYCFSDGVNLLNSGRTGGTFTGEGIADLGNGTANFSPRDAFLSASSDSLFDFFDFDIQYKFTDANGCADSSFQTTTINSLPDVSIVPDQTAICYDYGDLFIEAFPEPLAGAVGVFSGNGVDDFFDGTADFNSQLASSAVGITIPTAKDTLHPITYTFTNIDGCTNQATVNILVRKLPEVKFTGLNPAKTYCHNANEILLSSDSLNGEYELIRSGFDTDFAITDNLNGTAFFSPREATGDVGADSVFDGSTQHIVNYIYTDAFGCENNFTDTIMVLPLPDVEITGIADGDAFCYSEPSFQITGTPTTALGNFSGKGITDNGDGTANYNVQLAAINSGKTNSTFTVAATDEIIYVFTDANGCTNRETVETTINGLPNVEILGLDTAYCVNEDDPIEVNGRPRPSVGNSGTFSTIGMTIVGDGDAIFNPRAVLGNDTVGLSPTNHPIIYTFENNNGCVASDTSVVLIRTMPIVSFSGLDTSYCYNDPIVTLQGSPVGDGEFVSGGIITNFTNGTATYSPKLAADALGVSGESDQVVEDIIIYEFENQFDCENKIAKTVSIKPIPVVNIVDFQAEYCYNSGSDTLVGFPLASVGISSVFSGAGIVDLGNGSATFNPSKAAITIAGVDSTVLTTTHIITYTHIDNLNCSNSTQVSLQVNPLPAVSVSSLASTTMCYSASPIELRGNPRILTAPLQLASFAGFGITDNGNGTALFDPKQATTDAGITDPTAGEEDYLTKYTYTNAKGCTSSAEIETTVLPLPEISFTATNGGVNGNSKEYCPETPTFELTSSLSGNGSNSLALFSGDGVVDGIGNKGTFNPFLATSLRGNPNTNFSDTTRHVIQLQYTNSSLCSNVFYDTFTVNPKPIANFVVANNCGTTPIPLNGEGLTNTSIASWNWNFGDNITASSQNTTHQYASSGKYDVSLFIETDKGCRDSVVNQIRIGGKPTADFNFVRICLNDSVFFTDLSEVENISVDTLTGWSWTFDDPASSFPNASTIQNPIRKFSDIGGYDVQLVVQTNNNCADTITKRITILPVVPVDAFPYFEDFESGGGSWSAGGVNSSWEYGQPNGTNISFTPNGNNAWMTSLSSTYNENEASYVDGPCFDMSGLERPMVSMKIHSDTDAGRDGAVLQYSNDDGQDMEKSGRC